MRGRKPKSPGKPKRINEEERQQSPLEKQLERAVRDHLEARGFMTEKAHGSAYQRGWPDLYCQHPSFGHFWIEMKRPGEQLRETQMTKFRKWHKFGARIYVLEGVHQMHRLTEKPNWWHYCGGLFS